MTQDDLIAIEEIRQLKARYFRHMDRKDWDAWREVFTEDLVCDVSDDGGHVFESRAALLDFLPKTLDGVLTTHHGHMSEIEITGPTTARGTWAMEDHLLWPEGSPMSRLWGTGWYEEEYRRDGAWRIARMKLRRLRVEVDGELLFPRGGGA